MVRSTILVGLVIVLGIGSAQAQPAGKKVNFQEHILPFFQDKCIGCHNQDKKSAGVILNSYSKILEGGSSGAIVKSGDAEGSSLYQVVAHKAEPVMPPKSPKVADASIQLLEKWIKEGLLETPTGKPMALNKPTGEIALGTVRRGKPEGPPPMPEKPLSLEPAVITKRGNAVTAIAASPWAPLLAVGGQKQIILYNTDTLEFLGVLPYTEGFPNVLKFSRNGGFLLAGGGRGGKSGSASLYNIKTGEKVFTVGQEADAVLAADISPDQTQIALGGPSKVVRVYSTTDGKLLHEIRKHTDWVTSIEYSPDGVLLASGDRNGNLFIWESHNGKEYFTLKGHTNCINDISWRADGNVLSSVSEDGTLRLWEMENGTQIKSVASHAGGAQGLVFHRDGNIFTSGRDKLPKAWKTDATAIRNMEATAEIALKLAVSHDANRIFVGDWDGNILAYTVADGKKIDTLASNPPALKDRLDSAAKEIASLKEQIQKQKAEAAAITAQETKAKTDLANMQKSLADANQLVKDGPAKVKEAQQVISKALALQTQAANEMKSREVLISTLGESAKRIQDLANQNKQDGSYPRSLQLLNETITKLRQELPALQAVNQEKLKAHTQANADLKDLQAKIAASQPQIAAIPKQIEAQQKALAAIQAQIAPKNAAVAELEKLVTFKEAALQKYKAAATLAKTAKS